MKKRYRNKTCYKCDNAATSKEHIPPASLFPEEKDIKSSVLRKNLITVPSCDLHNSHKSQDDEFLMACLAGLIGNNIFALFHFKTKVKRTLEKKGKKFIDEIIKDKKPVSTADKKASSIYTGKADVSRLQKCFEHIAYGLYYYKFKKKFNGKCNLYMDFINYENNHLEKYKEVIRKRIEADPIQSKSEGANPEIFSYSFFQADEFGLIGLIMTFYEGTKVYAVFKEININLPYNLTAELIKSRIKTHKSFPDGSSVDFN